MNTLLNSVYPDMQSNILLKEMFDIINRRKSTTTKKLKPSDPNYEYLESHHIIPRSYFIQQKLNVDDSDDNLVLLSYSEHVIVHILLTKYFASKHNFKMYKSMYLAVLYMVGSCNYSLNLNLKYLKDLELLKTNAVKNGIYNTVEGKIIVYDPQSFKRIYIDKTNIDKISMYLTKEKYDAHIATSYFDFCKSHTNLLTDMNFTNAAIEISKKFNQKVTSTKLKKLFYNYAGAEFKNAYKKFLVHKKLFEDYKKLSKQHNALKYVLSFKQLIISTIKKSIIKCRIAKNSIKINSFRQIRRFYFRKIQHLPSKTYRNVSRTLKKIIVFIRHGNRYRNRKITNNILENNRQTTQQRFLTYKLFCQHLNRNLTIDELNFIISNKLVDSAKALNIPFSELQKIAIKLKNDIPTIPRILSGRNKSEVMSNRNANSQILYDGFLPNAKHKYVNTKHINEYINNGWITKDAYMQNKYKSLVDKIIELQDIQRAAKQLGYKGDTKLDNILTGCKKHLGYDYTMHLIHDTPLKNLMTEWQLAHQNMKANKQPFSEDDDDYIMSHQIKDAVIKLNKCASTIKKRRKYLRELHLSQSK